MTSRLLALLLDAAWWVVDRLYRCGDAFYALAGGLADRLPLELAKVRIVQRGDRPSEFTLEVDDP